MPDIQNINLEWLSKNFLCMMACPVHTEAGRYVNLIAAGRYEEAYRVARAPNPFASICGRICAAPCEDACRRGKLDQPISIRALKRFVTERFGVESLIDVIKLQELFSNQIKPKNKKVAIIGAGPSGLSCAHDLALMGYQVTVFEKQQVPGGMLRLGVPEYRLPRELIRMEVNAILSLGINLELGKTLGKDFFLKDLRNTGYDAVFIAMGAHKSRILNIEGSNADGILNAVDYLLNVNLGYRVDLGEKIVVIGGGNVAFDVARSVARREKPESLSSSDITAALDVARSAVRFGAKKVDMVVLESRNEMLADEEEIDQAIEERITIHNSIGPKRILTRNGKVEGLEIWNVASVLDDEGRFNPQFVSGSESIIPADSIIISIGQLPDLGFIQPEDGIAVTPRGMIEIDAETLSTTAKGIFAGGDAAFGPRIAITAIADGRKAAQSINTYLGGKESGQSEVKITCFNTATYRPQPGYTQIPRQPIPSLPLERRIGIAQVELGYNEKQARREGSRCLRCWENTIFEGDPDLGTECILCGGCADICPENCIEIIPKRLYGFDTDSEEDISEEFGISKKDIKGKGLVLIKNEEICIRCGLCARRCPVGTITMQGFEEAVPEFGLKVY
jgi:NADPH-dependent glutamate synthase beta subunit-like oxidoreductase/NAD-dependent dihydropyrimidine dehydrogenase PreA subunit